MTKTKPEISKARPARGEASKPSAKEDEPPRVDNTRETIESIIIALILAFLFRAFEAEAFEIPTGSMGPTLLGRNKDVECPKCGFGFQAGVSFEVDDSGRPVYFDRDWLPPGRQGLAGRRVTAETCTCPNCRYTLSVDPVHAVDDLLPVKHPYSYSGDRIWVSKAPYVVSDPKRWDVSVFKYPLGANINYIKRIVGLPNETVRIHWGNIHTSPLGTSAFEVAQAASQDTGDAAARLRQRLRAGRAARKRLARPLAADSRYVRSRIAMADGGRRTDLHDRPAFRERGVAGLSPHPARFRSLAVAADGQVTGRLPDAATTD